MKRNCKTCTLNTTNDTVETCRRMCYLRYSKQRNKRICDLEQKIQNLKQILAEIKKIAKNSCCLQPISICEEYENCKECSRTSDDATVQQILQKISEYEVRDDKSNR